MSQLNKRIEILVFCFCLTVAILNPGVAVGAGSDRIYPTKEVTIYNGDKMVGRYTREAPLPEGVTISTNGRCAIKFGDLYLVAEDQSELSANSSDRQRNLFVKEGIIYFKTSSIKQPLNILTPSGQITVQSIHLKASFTNKTITGYVNVEKGKSELGVVQGGSINVLTDNGYKMIKSGEKILLAQADMDIGAPESKTPESEVPVEEQTAEQKKGMSTMTKGLIAAGVGVVAIGALVGLGGGGGGGGGGGSVSPSSP